MQNTKRNEYLDVVKALAIIFVVIGHCIQCGSGRQYSSGAFYENPIFIFIYSFHMPLFMLISGYLFAFSVKNKKWHEVLLIKVKQLIVPLCSWSIVSLFVTIFEAYNEGAIEGLSILWIIKELIRGFVFGPWFLWAIWWCSLVVILVKNLLGDSFVVYAFGFLLTFIIPDIMNLHLYKFMYPFFVLAYLFNAHDYKTKMKKNYCNKFLVFSVFSLFVILLCLWNRESYIYTSKYTVLGKDIGLQLYNNCFRFTIGLVGGISMIYLIYALMNLLPTKIKECFVYIGKNTLGIYLISNIIVQEVLEKVTASLARINYIYVLLETIIVLLLSIAINAVLKRYKITNILFLGGR